MSVWDWIFCLAFIAIGIVGGVVIGGIMQHHTAFIVAGICFALIGVVALISGSSARPQLQPGPEFHVFVNLANQTWAWIAAVALLLIAVAAFFIWPIH
jgi:hypothetical protein